MITASTGRLAAAAALVLLLVLSPALAADPPGVVGSKATWKMQCSGQMPMQGTGEINFEGSDAYTGVVQATAQGMNMTVKLAGKKVGTCDNPQ